MDIISIRDLKIQTQIGVHDWEQKIKQPLSFDIDLYFKTNQASQTDDINDAIDYATLSQKVMEYTQASSFALLETLAQKLCDLMLSEFPVETVKLTVKKPHAVPEAKIVALTIERNKTA